jgi:hypothetical protein
MGHILSKTEGFKKRADFYYVDPTVIIVKDGWNARKDFTGERELIDSIIAVGVRQPLLVKKNKHNLLELIKGKKMKVGFTIAWKGSVLIKKFSELTRVADCDKSLCLWLGFDPKKRNLLTNIDGNYLTMSDFPHDVWCCNIKGQRWYGKTLIEVAEKAGIQYN